ncbi:MAG: hypothetical protein K2I87_02890 [Bacteroidales bacterium]|nr:hypothetical protein [Bacteroidales bacterium]
MKKLTCILLVAMFTMLSMVFAQPSSGTILVSDYITITNTTTQESKTISTSDFTSEGNDKYTYDVDFCLSVYTGDKLEITYKAKTIILDPNVAWTYSWSNGFSSSLGSALTANLSVNSVPSNSSVLTFTCNYLGNKQKPTSRFYSIRLKNVHDVERIQVKRDNINKNFIISYRYYDEALSCIKQDAVAYLYSGGTFITSSSFHAYGDIGVASLSTGNHPAPYIVKVMVNNKSIFTGQYR